MISIPVAVIVGPRGWWTRIGLRSIIALMALGVLLADELQAQTSDAPAQTAAPASADSAAESLAKYVTNDRLVLLVENYGLNNYAEAWQKTNAFKLLTGTPLGPMMEAVGAQFIDQMLAKITPRKVTGSEVVALVKHVAQNGWLLAINSVDKGSKPYRITLVLKGATSKSVRPVTSRFLGLVMGDIKPRLVKKENRTIIAVDVPAKVKEAVAAKPAAAPGAVGFGATAPGAVGFGATAPGAVGFGTTAPPAAKPAADEKPVVKSPPLTWIWWPEQDDLVVGIFPNDDGALMLSTIDGKTPSAISNPELVTGKKAESGFRPISTRLMDLNAINGFVGEDWLMSLLGQVKELTGAKRIVQRVGLGDSALITKTRLASPKPYTSVAALFDTPPFKKTDLIPIPEAVKSFVTVSIRAEKLTGLIDHLDSTGELKTKLDEFRKSLKETARVDLENDFLARLGPKMTCYLSPLRSAEADDDSLSFQSLFGRGVNLTSLVAVASPFIPEATFVAEVKDPVAFTKALDGFIIALNHEIKARATEIEKEEEAAKQRVGGGGRDDDDERRGGAGADRNKSRKKPEIQTPKFNPHASPTGTRKFQLSTPTASKLRLGPQHFRPVIYMDGRYLVISASAKTADLAIAALAQKDWKPSADVEKALADIPDEVVSLAILDPGQTAPSMLSSFPAMVQAQINSGIALSNVQVTEMPRSPAGAPAGPAAAMMRGRDAPVPRHAKDADDFFDFQGQAGGGYAGAQMYPGGARPAVPPQTIRLQVGPEQLPKAEEIKPLLFPTTVFMTGDKDGLTLSQRSAFPEQIGIESNAMILGLMMPTIQSALIRFHSTTGPATNQPNAMGANPGGQMRPGAASGVPGRRRRRDEF
jgi:hypothetical protein